MTTEEQERVAKLRALDNAVNAIATVLATLAPRRSRGELLMMAYAVISRAESGDELAPHDQRLAASLEFEFLSRN